MLGKMRPDLWMYLGSPGISAPEGFLIKRLLFAQCCSLVHVTLFALRCEIKECFRGCVSIRVVSWGSLSSWADGICPFNLLATIMNVSVSQGVWNSTALRQICSAVHHAPSSSADIVDLSLAAPSQNVSERWSEVFASYMSEKEGICPSLSATLRAEGQVEVTSTVTIVKHSLMHLHPAACESLQRTLSFSLL